MPKTSKKAPKKKRASKKSTKKDVEMRVPPHGRGLLRTGNPGNRGGGRPTEPMRRVLANDAMSARDVMIEMLDLREPCSECGLKVTLKEATMIFDKFAKFGIGTQRSGMEPELMFALAEAVQSELDATDEQMQSLFRRWRRVIGTFVAGDA